jgi:glucose repression regulatory protein TUP1
MPPLPPGPSANASTAGKAVVAAGGGGGVGGAAGGGAGGEQGQEEFSFNNVPPEFRREGTDWFAAFNPKIKKCLDIGLVHSFGHTRWVGGLYLL